MNMSPRLRRRLPACLLGALVAALPAVVQAAAPAPQPPDLKTEYAFTARVKVDVPIIIGQGAEGLRRFVPITGGDVDGPLFKGRVLNGSGDWQFVRADDVLDLEARYVLESPEGDKIAVTNAGYRHGPADVIASMARGENVAPSRYYFRTAARFDAPRGSKYEWLNRTLFVTTAERQADLVIVHFYRIL